MKHDLVARMIAEAMKPLSDRMAEIEAFIATHAASHEAPKRARKAKDDEDGA
jgi:hypothetical protein